MGYFTFGREETGARFMDASPLLDGVRRGGGASVNRVVQYPGKAKGNIGGIVSIIRIIMKCLTKRWMHITCAHIYQQNNKCIYFVLLDCSQRIFLIH